MEEKILQTKKNGMVMLLLTLLGYAVTVLLFFYSIILLDESLFPGILLTILSIAYWVAGIFLLCGLKVLKPQEALVLTLFGDYIGTLKGQGFYWVNPFCTAVNPAAGTKLSQSGDVNSGETGMDTLMLVGSHLARDRYRKGRIQCGQLQGVPLPAVRQRSAQCGARLPL